MRKRQRRDTAFLPRKRQRIAGQFTGITTIRAGGKVRQFVPRTLGTPLAITERKYFDGAFAATAIPVGLATAASGEMDLATTNTLFAPTTGDDFNNRSGRKVQVIQIKLRGNISVATQVDQIAADQSPVVRFLLVQDKQTNTAQLNSEDVVQTVGIYGWQNPAFFGRFQVLKDKIMKLPAPTITWDGTNLEQAGYHFPFKIGHKFRKPVTVHFNSTNGGTVADITDNSFHLLGFTSTTNLAPTLAYQSRVTFIDV